MNTLIGRLAAKEVILLAGACGTEIQRRGVKTSLPLWSASALETHPDVVRDIHHDYIDAGAEIITTNTFRTNTRTFRDIGGEQQSRELTLKACALARQARDESGKDVWIGGSVAPVEDCYAFDKVPGDAELLEEHAVMANNLRDGGVDFIFIETMNCIRETIASAEAADSVGLRIAVSFVCNENGNLLNGDSIEEAVDALAPFRPIAVMTNCRPPEIIQASVDRLLRCSPYPVGVYANGDGHPDDDEGWKFTGIHPEETYSAYAREWIRKGVQIVGGCCGTTPDYIRRLRNQ